MTSGNRLLLSFPAVARKKVAAAFNGGRLSSDDGVKQLAVADQRLGFAERLALRLPEHLYPGRIMPSRGWPVRPIAGRPRAAWCLKREACAPFTRPVSPTRYNSIELQAVRAPHKTARLQSCDRRPREVTSPVEQHGLGVHGKVGQLQMLGASYAPFMQWSGACSAAPIRDPISWRSTGSFSRGKPMKY